MKTKLTFSNKQLMFIFGAIGLLLGAVLVGVLLNARSVSAQKGAISKEAAQAAAEAAYPGTKAVEVEMDDSGRNAYEVELDNGVEVIVDAVTGQIVDTGTEENDDVDDGNDANDANDVEDGDIEGNKDSHKPDVLEAAPVPLEQIGDGFCTATASVQFNACQSEATDDFFTAQALCLQITDGTERQQCFLAAALMRIQDNQLCGEQRDAREYLCDSLGEGQYDPNFDPALFDHDFANLTNPNSYFPLGIGNVWEYMEGDETVTVEVLNKTKLIEGVTCIVVNDFAKVNGVPLENTDDWFGQRLDGTVDYCGEMVRNYEVFAGDNPMQPELVNIDGSFKAGQDALPGTIFLGNPTVGMIYRQEWAPGDAEDAAVVLSISYSYGSDPTLDEFVPQELAELLCSAGDCVVTGDFTPIEPGGFARKYYAAGIGFFLEIKPDSGDTLQLVSCSFNPICADLPR